jgi:hypothetical protein
MLLALAPFTMPDDPPKWPTYVNGKAVHRTFTFKPAGVECQPQSTRRATTRVVFRIKDPAVPADTFVVASVTGRAEDVEERVKKYLADRGGMITVDAHWVNAPREPDTRGEGRLLLGNLVPPLPGRR